MLENVSATDLSWTLSPTTMGGKGGATDLSWSLSPTTIGGKGGNLASGLVWTTDPPQPTLVAQKYVALQLKLAQTACQRERERVCVCVCVAAC